MKTLYDALKYGQRMLEGLPDALVDARILLEHAIDCPGRLSVLQMQENMPAGAADRYEALLHRRKTGEPTQYIIHKAWFMGLEFFVDERVLIPRQDTETLCETALQMAEGRGYETALDLCTGSGALAVALAKQGIRMDACDISGDALCVAQLNAKKHGADISFYRGDLFDALPKGSTYDVIVSNPPYIATCDMQALQSEVRREPAMALDGGKSGLCVYKRIAQAAHSFIRPGGALLLELGIGQAKEVVAMFPGRETKLTRDINGIERVLCVL